MQMHSAFEDLASNSEWHQDGVCTGSKGLLECGGLEHAEKWLKCLRVLHVDGEARRDERVQCVEGHKSDSHGRSCVQSTGTLFPK